MPGKSRTATNLNFYRLFLAVYETKNVRAAADIAGITHSAVSQNLSVLSKQLGVKLFHPQVKGVVPTTDADALYPTIRRIIDDIDALENKVKVFSKDSIGTIKIVCTTNFASTYLTPAMAKFRRIYNNIQFVILNRQAKDALKLLEKRQVDLVLSVVPLNELEGDLELQQIEIESFPQSFYASKKFAEEHNLKDTISKERFNELPFMALSTFRHFIKDIKEPDILVDTQEILFHSKEENLGISFGISHSIEKKYQHGEMIRLKVDGITPKNAELTCTYLNITLLTKATSAFLEFLKKSV